MAEFIKKLFFIWITKIVNLSARLQISIPHSSSPDYYRECNRELG